MSLVQLPRNFDFTELLVRPENVLIQSGGFGTFDVSGEYRAQAIPAHRALNIDRIAFHCANVSGSPQVTASIESLSTTTGLDDGLWSANTSGLSDVLTNGYRVVVLDATASIPMGSVYCPKIAWAAGSLQIRTIAGINQATEGLPYDIVNGTIGPGDGTTFAVGNANEWYSTPTLYPCQGSDDQTWDNTSGTLKRGLKFVPTFRAEISAVRLVHNTNNNGNYDIVVYDAVDTELSRTSVLGTRKRSIQRYVDYALSPRVTVEPGETYRIVLEPQEAVNIHLSRIFIPNGFSAAWAGDGVFGYTSHDGTNWTDNDHIPALFPFARAI